MAQSITFSHTKCLNVNKLTSRGRLIFVAQAPSPICSVPSRRRERIILSFFFTAATCKQELERLGLRSTFQVQALYLCTYLHKHRFWTELWGPFSKFSLKSYQHYFVSYHWIIKHREMRLLLMHWSTTSVELTLSTTENYDIRNIKWLIWHGFFCTLLRNSFLLEEIPSGAIKVRM